MQQGSRDCLSYLFSVSAPGTLLVCRLVCKRWQVVIDSLLDAKSLCVTLSRSLNDDLPFLAHQQLFVDARGLWYRWKPHFWPVLLALDPTLLAEITRRFRLDGVQLQVARAICAHRGDDTSERAAPRDGKDTEITDGANVSLYVKLQVLHDEIHVMPHKESHQYFSEQLRLRFADAGLNLEQSHLLDEIRRPFYLSYLDKRQADEVVHFDSTRSISNAIFAAEYASFFDTLWGPRKLHWEFERAIYCDFERHIYVFQTARATAVSEIHRKARKGAWLRNAVISDHLTSMDEADQRLFVESTAAWMMFLRFLGNSDRHSDNILVTDTGTLICNDFSGCIFGNRKSKFGIKLKKMYVPFSPHIEAALGEQGYHDFELILYETMSVLRQQHSFSILSHVALSKYCGDVSRAILFTYGALMSNAVQTCKEAANELRVRISSWTD